MCHTLRSKVAYKAGCNARCKMSLNEARSFVAASYTGIGGASAFWAGFYGNNF